MLARQVGGTDRAGAQKRGKVLCGISHARVASMRALTSISRSNTGIKPSIYNASSMQPATMNMQVAPPALRWCSTTVWRLP